MPGLKLVAQLGLDGAGFQAGFKAAEGIAKSSMLSIKNMIVGAIGIGTIQMAISKTVQTANELINTSMRLDVAPKQLQLMQQAAANANFDLEKMIAIMEKLDVAREKALMPGPQGQAMRRAFMAGGIGMDALRGQTAAQLLMGPVSSLAKTKNAEQIGIIFEELSLGRRGFSNLITFLKTDFEKLSKEMDKFGAFMDTATAVQIKAATNALEFLTKIIVSNLAPVLMKFSEWMAQAVITVARWVSILANAAYGAVQGKTPAQTAAALTAALGSAIKYGMGLSSAEKYKEETKGQFNVGMAKQLGKEEMKYWDGIQASFEKMKADFAKFAASLDNPKPPDFTKATIPPLMDKATLTVPTDNLTKVGNFLGGNGQILTRLAERQVYLLQKIHDDVRKLGQVGPNRGPSIMHGPNFPHS